MTLTSGSQHRYARVGQQAVANTTGPDLAQALLRNLDDNATVGGAVAAGNADEPNIMLARLRLDTHLAGREARDVIWLYDDPKRAPDVTLTMERVGPALTWLADEARLNLDAAPLQVRTALNTRRRRAMVLREGVDFVAARGSEE
ncbi:hypothetical protein NEMBOFW57_005488 [Staphylotrichum longicolle]|uniref:Uncharacterized protein n=1 Tax=Staphylotrichum longicolle TaxID=669026 RepID=A0AAD4I0B9_9PEZI|nr:hypothetical protein NEMBOFW57_005488 [Staphylotrichum longicolle]